MMITIISATNRPNSNTLKVAQKYSQLMEKQGVKSELLSLESLPHDFIFTDMYGKRSDNFQQLLDKCIIPAQKFAIVVPEYNGSYAGILKSFLDAIPPEINKGKKVVLIGVSSGRAGNIRGLDHLTSVLHHLGMHVHPNKLPISSVLTMIDSDGNLVDEKTLLVLENQTIEFLKW